jgi:hypothetical protein
MPTNEEFDPGLKTVSGPRDAENPGYEIEDVNVSGIATFVAGLSGFVLIFYFFCFFMGKVINHELIKADGDPDRWHQIGSTMAETPHGQKREDLTSNFEFEQRQLSQVAKTFPTPRLETDDGNQDTADMHAKEDLLLDNYSTSTDIPAGNVRIPIERAMDLVVARGLPKPAGTQSTAPLMVGESKPTVMAPLTTGFARTGYELQTIEARAQKNDYEKAEAKQ